MDAPEPPRILLEGAGPCPSPGRLQALLHSSLGPALAPAAGWLVSLRLEKTTSRVLRAEGDITDGDGTPVARRVVLGSLADCEALARAIGVWASLVLDAEISRPTSPTDELSRRSSIASGGGVSPTPSGSAGPPPADATSGGSASGGDLSSAPPSEATSAAVSYTPAPRPIGESEALPLRAEPQALELGLGTFLMVGPEGRAFAGATPYAVIETGRGVFMRPSLAVGEGVPSSSSNDPLTWAAGRFDACLRMRGLYPTNRGLKLDLCAGADGGLTYHSANRGAQSSATAMTPFVSMGPSVDMDGDLAGALSLVLRGVAGINIVPDGWSGRIEVALSWRLR